MSYDGGWAEPKVPLTALTPYLGRLVKLITTDEEHPRVGFLSAIHSGQFVLDDIESVPQNKVLAAYNIVNKKIAGEGPDIYNRYKET